MDLLRRDVDKIQGHITEVKHWIGNSEDVIGDHSTRLHTLQTKVKALESRAEDAENCNRRNNFCILGVWKVMAQRHLPSVY